MGLLPQVVEEALKGNVVSVCTPVMSYRAFTVPTIGTQHRGLSYRGQQQGTCRVTVWHFSGNMPRCPWAAPHMPRCPWAMDGPLPQVRLLGQRTTPSLDLPKIRRNARVEIVPINSGVLEGLITSALHPR